MADLLAYRAYTMTGITGLTDAQINESANVTDVSYDAGTTINGVLTDQHVVEITANSTNLPDVNSKAIGSVVASLVIVFRHRADGSGQATGTPTITATIADAVCTAKSPGAPVNGNGTANIVYRAKACSWS
jgi:hypothetical protein